MCFVYSHCTVAGQSNTESLIILMLFLFVFALVVSWTPKREKEAQDLSLAAVKITQLCGTSPGLNK